MSPKQGHIAMQVNGGLLGTNLVLGPDQAPLLIKGNIRKGAGVQRNDPLAEDAAREAVKAAAGDDRDRLQKVVVNQHFETVLTTLDAQGNFVTATEPLSIALGRLLLTTGAGGQPFSPAPCNGCESSADKKRIIG